MGIFAMSTLIRTVNIKPVALALLYTVTSGISTVSADDTEVFFGAQTAQSTSYPNVLFILDTSGSMAGTDGTGITRLDRMKTAVEQILDSATNINVGLMRYNGYNSGGSIIYPVTYIDKELCPNGICTGPTSDVSLSVRVDQSTDDAVENSSSLSMTLDADTLDMFGNTTSSGGTDTFPVKHRYDDAEQRISNSYLMLDSWDLDMFWDVNWQRSEGVAGIRIPDIDIPQGAAISSARLLMQGDPSVANGLVAARIHGEDIGDSPRFANSNGRRVLDRVKTTEFVDWDSIPFPVASNNGLLETPDLSSIVEARVQNPSWVTGNGITFLFENKDTIAPAGAGNNRRIIPYGYASSSNVPRLEVTWTTDTSTDQIGLRFNDVRIPQGVTISSASIEFTSNGSHSASTTGTIYGQDSDNASTFTHSNGNITGRSKTSASASWTPENWTTAGELYQTSDITNVVQEIVDRSGWCGGNSLALFLEGTGMRKAIAFDQSPADAPVLKVEYDATTIPDTGGCTVAEAKASIAVSSDDVEQRLSNGDMSFSSSDLELPYDGSSEQIVGLRFRSLNVPRGATITDAYITFTVDEYKSGNISMDIHGMNTAAADYFSGSDYYLQNFPKTSAGVMWNNLPAPAVGETMTTPDLKSIIQEIVNKSGWNSGNAMGFLLSRKSGTGTRTVESYNGEPTMAPKLTIIYQANGASGTDSGQITYMTTRDQLKLSLNDMRYKGGTPSVGALYEAARYFKGMDVQYGLERGLGGNKHQYHRVSHPSSYTGGTVNRPSGCTDDDLNDYDCKQETISNSPQYISPMNDTCQTNHIVMLSDGQPTSSEAINQVKSMIGSSSCTSRGSGTCGEELAYYLKHNDQSNSVSGLQDITTYTIGFNFTSDWMRDVATAGGGSFYEADSSAQLVDAFNNILAEILKVDTSFVSPGATVSQFNRLTHRNDIYFSLFKPSEKPTWAGNLKQYKLIGNPAEIVDVSGNTAVDPDSGFFKDSSRSFWSDELDGSDVAKGGAANELDADTRKVYSNISTSSDLTNANNSFHESNSYLTKNLMGVSGQSDTYYNTLVRWSRGVDTEDENGNGDTTDTRFHMGDPMHSRPVIVNYSDTDSVVFVGTNEGFLHAIDTDDGSEVYSFIPAELLPNLDKFYTNHSSIDHPYGLDGPITTWTDDDTGKRYLYVGMRRGGNSYYALDITSKNNPKLQWVIDGDTTSGFSSLGQTWSKPIATKVKFGGSEKKVLIFAGGYDTNQDNVSVTTPDSVGNAIYMVDAVTGSLIWSAGASGSGATEEFGEMIYSMPAKVTVLDVNFDELADQMYIGDMGGQVWRFDIDNFASGKAQLVEGGVMASLAGSGDANARRFYYSPDVSLISTLGKQTLAVSIGSGWRAHPLDLKVEDRFYMVRSDSVYVAPEGYGKKTGSTWSPVTESDLIDVTNDLTPDMSSGQGWMMKMETNGEKILAESLTLNNQVIFTTYRPEQASSACSAALGGGAAYIVSVVDGSPTTNLNGQGEDTDLTKDDRNLELAHDGIPPEAVALFTADVDNPNDISTSVAIGSQLFNNIGGQLTNRTFWQNNPEGAD